MTLDVRRGRQSYGAPAVLDNLSAAGCYLRLACQVIPDESLLVIAQIAQALVALRGSVLRVEPQADGYGAAVAIEQYKIFSLPAVDK